MFLHFIICLRFGNSKRCPRAYAPAFIKAFLHIKEYIENYHIYMFMSYVPTKYKENIIFFVTCAKKIILCSEFAFYSVIFFHNTGHVFSTRKFADM
jgi:hypothetical protein